MELCGWGGATGRSDGPRASSRTSGGYRAAEPGRPVGGKFYRGPASSSAAPANSASARGEIDGDVGRPRPAWNQAVTISRPLRPLDPPEWRFRSDSSTFLDDEPLLGGSGQRDAGRNRSGGQIVRSGEVAAFLELGSRGRPASARRGDLGDPRSRPDRRPWRKAGHSRPSRRSWRSMGARWSCSLGVFRPARPSARPLHGLQHLVAIDGPSSRATAFGHLEGSSKPGTANRCFQWVSSGGLVHSFLGRRHQRVGQHQLGECFMRAERLNTPTARPRRAPAATHDSAEDAEGRGRGTACGRRSAAPSRCANLRGRAENARSRGTAGHQRAIDPRRAEPRGRG